MNKIEKPRTIVLDGHDGAGKTTLARLVADHLGGKYVRPFGGELGDMITWLWRRKNFDFADQLARSAVEKVLDENSNTPLLVFDRHWLSLFTVLPEKYYKNWFPLPCTILCWANVETTQRRLNKRGELPGEREKHQHYCSLYKKLANQFKVPVIDTTDITINEAMSLIISELNIEQVRNTL